VTVAIREERPEDRDASLEVERLAFGSDEEAAIIEVIRDEPGSFALVAEDDGEIVGHAQVSRAWIGQTAVLTLGPIGVHPDRQGEGIGSALVRATLGGSARRSGVALILLGSPAFYPRFGFRPGSELGLLNPYTGVQESRFVIREEDFMLVVLDPAVPLTGPVRWHPAFGEPAV
jgi:putative acetyltransferase